MTHVFAPPPENQGLFRILAGSIVVMTLAAAFMLGMIVGRILTPSGAPAPSSTDLVAAEASEVALTLPQGARALEVEIGADRMTVLYETADGAREVFTAPLSALRGPARVRVVTVEE